MTAATTSGALADDDDPGVCKVYAHGNWAYVSDRKDGIANKKVLYAEDLNKLLNKLGCDGKPIELYACSTGANGPKGQMSIAEPLSKLKGRNGVLAPTKSVWYTEDGLLPLPYGHKDGNVKLPRNRNDVGRIVEYK